MKDKGKISKDQFSLFCFYALTYFSKRIPVVEL
jgi:hypothetical protein